MQDTFEDLLVIIGSSAGINFTDDNIACIRPYVSGVDQKTINAMKNAWIGKRPACGGKYNATSLVRAFPAYSIGSVLKYSIGTDSNGYINSATQFYNAIHVPLETTLINNILQVAGGGSRPINSLTLIGHSKNNSQKIGSDGTSGETFEFENLGNRNNTPRHAWSWVTWSDAVNNVKTLPYGCWFSYNATIRLVGCYTETMASKAANTFVRQGGWVFGTELQTWVRAENGVLQMGWKKGAHLEEGLFRNTPEEYHLTKYWKSYNGTK